MEKSFGPLARKSDLIIEELGDEVLVYDEKADVGHCLSPEAARVWRRCDGRTPVEGLSAQLGISVEEVKRALDELETCVLLEERPQAGEGSTRRELTVKMVKTGAVVAAAPMILSVAAPTPAMAATLAECGPFSSGNCGGKTGCSKTLGCCCCISPVNRQEAADHAGDCPFCNDYFNLPGNENAQECKTCVPIQTTSPNSFCTLCGHASTSACG